MIREKEEKYGAHSLQAMDLYFPDGKKPEAILLMVHGGAWQYGDKSDYALMARHYAKKGLVVACVNYRLVPEVHYPKPVEDVAEALAFLTDKAEEYHFPPDKIFAFGHSAGAHLASLVALGEDDEFGKKTAGRKLAGVIAVSGVYDFSMLPEDVFYIVPEFLGENEAKNAQVFRRAQPLLRARKTQTKFVVFEGSNDFVVNRPGALKRQGELFAEELRKSGTEAEYHLFEGDDHNTIVSSRNTASMVEEFIARN